MPNRFVEKLQRYAELTPEAIEALSDATDKPRTIGSRRDLIREGDRPGPVIVMLDGWAMRYKILPNGSRQVMAFLMPGDACDLHVGLLSEMDHSIQTLTTSRVSYISGERMERLLDEHPTIAKAMYTVQLADEGTLRSWIVSMGRRSSVERVAHLICEIYVRGGHNVGLSEGEFELPVSQVVLADALGMTPVHINRMLRELRERNVVGMRRNSLSILDPLALVRIAGWDDNYLHRRMRDRS